jgi:DNA repair exonuclease SbcCD ATPase subunit
MIKKAILINFMSYEHSEVSFDGSTIAVVGDNGDGKSAFLEAVPYVYYGIGRENKEGLSRIKGDGSHSVEIWEDGDVRIKRGRKVSGAGFCEVHVAGELVAKGTGADSWIVDHLGMDKDTYMLISFYGLIDSHNDKLLRVLPSARLESMQSLAEVGPYKSMLKKAKDKYEKSERTYAIEKARAEGAKEAMTDAKKLQDGLSAGNNIVVAVDEDLKHFKKERCDLQIEEEAYQAFVREKERVGVERANLHTEIESLVEEQETLGKDINNNTEAVDENRKRVEQLSKKLLGMDADSLSKRSDKIQEDSGGAKAKLALKKSALDVPVDKAECPLCGQSITQTIIHAWSTAVEELQDKLKSLRTEAVQTKEQIDLLAGLKDEVLSLGQETKNLIEIIQTAEKRIKVIRRDVVKFESEAEKKDDRFVFLVEKLGDEYQGLQKKIENVSNDIDVAKQRKHTALGQMTQIKQSLARNKTARKAIQEAKKIMAQKRRDMVAANLLRKAWSRYGIPLQLIKSLSQRIEKRASTVYQGFDNGRIEVREVEDRGKPGIQFFLVDRKGDRTFNQLSVGEKVMFFISVRVALAQIVAADKPITVDYVILDEAMGNLSPRRQDDLIRLINKVLRRIFPQLILVSHTEMRDIFSQTIRITAENGISNVEVA